MSYMFGMCSVLIFLQKLVAKKWLVFKNVNQKNNSIADIILGHDFDL